MDEVKGALARAYLEDCLEHRSGSLFSDSPWFKEGRNSNLSRKTSCTLDLVKRGMGFKLKRQQSFVQEAMIQKHRDRAGGPRNTGLVGSWRRR